MLDGVDIFLELLTSSSMPPFDVQSLLIADKPIKSLIRSIIGARLVSYLRARIGYQIQQKI